MSKTESSVLTLLLAAAVVIWLTQRIERVPAKLPAAAENVDYWTTPFYLRSNVPVVDGSTWLLPQQANNSWSLGVPASFGG
jgi:hypothetical protein